MPTTTLRMIDILHAAVNGGASDVLLVAAAPPMFRIDGELRPPDLPKLSPAEIEDLCHEVMTDVHREQLAADRDADFSVTFPGLGRFRFNVHVQRGSMAAAIRLIPDDIPGLHDLGMPEIVEELTKLTHGLVLVTGQTGSGKTTTLASMIATINGRDSKHVITLEDPVEYRFEHGRAIVEQREIGSDCPSFASGLRHVLRQDPDVILVGELRDLETIRTALQAAETGHLVLATLHTSSAPGAIDRIIEVFPAEEQTQVRSHLGGCLRAIVTQQLLPAADGRGRVAAVETLVATNAVRTSIREGSTHLVPGIMSTGRRDGMQTMEQAVKELVLNGRIDLETADEILPK